MVQLAASPGLLCISNNLFWGDPDVDGDWMELAQDRDRWGGTCEYGKEILGSIKMQGISWLDAKTG
jgi:hypothetical protein